MNSKETIQRLGKEIPYIGYLGIEFDLRGDELTAVLPFQWLLVGNPTIPAIHGGVTASLLEVTARMQLAWRLIQREDFSDQSIRSWKQLELPKTISFSVDYLRPGNPVDSFARARVNRSGRRYASVHAEAWQEQRDRLYAQGTGHFLMAQLDD